MLGRLGEDDEVTIDAVLNHSQIGDRGWRVRRLQPVACAFRRNTLRSSAGGD